MTHTGSKWVESSVYMIKKTVWTGQAVVNAEELRAGWSCEEESDDYSFTAAIEAPKKHTKKKWLSYPRRKISFAVDGARQITTETTQLSNARVGDSPRAACTPFLRALTCFIRGFWSWSTTDTSRSKSVSSSAREPQRSFCLVHWTGKTIPEVCLTMLQRFAEIRATLRKIYQWQPNYQRIVLHDYALTY